LANIGGEIVTKLCFQTFLLDNPLTPFNKGERKVPSKEIRGKKSNQARKQSINHNGGFA